jgi:hypothetical protein
MKKIGTVIIVLAVGFMIGLVTSIYLFAIDVDVLAIPYVNEGIVTKEDILIEQNDILLEIPRGTQMTLIRRMPGTNEYAIYFYAYWDDETLIETISSKPKHFELKKKEQQELQ